MNLGCGRVILDGYVNLDKNDLDLNVFPYPFADNSVDEILLSHVIEHLDNQYGCILELHRILKPDGKLIVRVPTDNKSIAHKRISFDYASMWCFDLNNRNENKQSHKLFKVNILFRRRSFKYWLWRKFIGFLNFFYTEVEYEMVKRGEI